MKLLNIRIAIAAIACTILPNIVSAQVTKTDYFMETSYLRNSLNPALRPDQGYLVIPVLPNVGVGAQTNKLNLDNLTFAGPDGKRVTFMHPSVNASDFMSNIADDNYLNTDINLKLFGLGFYKGDAFWNIDLGLRTHVDANIPKGFFQLFKEGFDQDKQKPFDLSELSATGTSFVELGVSYSRPFMDNNLMLGVRVKLLGGAGDLDLNAKTLSIDAGPEYWKARSQVTMKGAGPGNLSAKYDSETGNIDGFDVDGFNAAGYGAGLDLGAVYDLKGILPILEGLRVSAAINDIGFISWSKKSALDLKSSDTEVTIKPGKVGEDGESLSDVFEDAFDNLQEATNLTGENKAYTSKLRMNINAGVEYEVLKHKFSVGALYSRRFGNYFDNSEFTASLNGRLCPWVSTSVSYSFIHSGFGAALHLAPTKGISLFLASDYATPHVNSDFLPTTSKALNFQFGISIPLGLKKSRTQVADITDESESI